MQWKNCVINLIGGLKKQLQQQVGGSTAFTVEWELK